MRDARSAIVQPAVVIQALRCSNGERPPGVFVNVICFHPNASLGNVSAKHSAPVVMATAQLGGQLEHAAV